MASWLEHQDPVSSFSFNAPTPSPGNAPVQSIWFWSEIVAVGFLRACKFRRHHVHVFQWFSSSAEKDRRELESGGSRESRESGDSRRPVVCSTSVMYAWKFKGSGKKENDTDLTTHLTGHIVTLDS